MHNLESGSKVALEGYGKIEYKKKLPMMIDQETQLNDISVGPGAKVIYHYSLPNYKIGEIDKDLLQSNIANIQKNICSNTEMIASFKLGAVYAYEYKDKIGNNLTQFELTKKDCNIE